jgi:mannose-1-phosphate guanylyltransferase
MIRESGMLHAVVMAGGSGTRFWPQSRAALPKQFLRLFGEETLLAATLSRVGDWIPPERSWVVTNKAHAAQTQRQLPALPSANILQEPCGRNTAPCIGLAALQIAARDPEGIMLVMPADHFVPDPAAFRKAVERAVSVVTDEPSALILFGVRPTYACTGFGYIERGEVLPGKSSQAWHVASFREKPDRARAEEFLAAGRFYWNSGIFVWKAATILQALERFEPSLAKSLKRLEPSVGTADWANALATEFPAMKGISIDYAVLERADNVCVLEAPFEWDDVGSWQALSRRRGSDPEGNTVEGPFCGVESTGCIISTTPDHIVATIGLSDCVIVHTPDATLVARKDDEEGIRKLVQLLRERGHEQFL